jgi:hypothetical protein
VDLPAEPIRKVHLQDTSDKITVGNKNDVHVRENIKVLLRLDAAIFLNIVEHLVYDVIHEDALHVYE